ncbi:MAG TPA: hypothetical protein VFG33_32630 [Kribbella sp.]|uniref:hypothetical protein n=1 Tax=Kribbella sp. TaxID=1871183 RepID=UPI002D79D3A9|nr:hypothetical protein [Kribbella sp.]HET6298169.1 hypothetical protein [Kribbella sp.]
MRAKNWLLSLGLLAAMAWTITVTMSTPNWFDPSEDCARIAGLGGDYGISVTNQWLPPRSTCHFGNGQVYEFISPTRSSVLTVLAVLIALAVAIGLVLATKCLFETGGVIRSDEAIDLRKRRITHLVTAAFAGGVAIGVYAVVGVFFIFLGGIPGVVLALLSDFLVLAVLVSALDRSYGPLPSTRARSRRRGTAAAAITFAAVSLAAAQQITSSEPGPWSVAFPSLLLRAMLVAAVVLPIVVAVQWARPSRPALPEPELIKQA